MYPVHNMANNLVYSCSGDQVEMTVVDGRVLYEKGEFTTIDIEKLFMKWTRQRKEYWESYSMTKRSLVQSAAILSAAGHMQIPRSYFQDTSGKLDRF